MSLLNLISNDEFNSQGFPNRQYVQLGSGLSMQVLKAVDLNNGWVDTFRFKNPDVKGAYSWWSQRFPTVRLQNKGWRIDYICVTDSLKENIQSATIYPDVKHSDHCPIFVELSN